MEELRDVVNQVSQGAVSFDIRTQLPTLNSLHRAVVTSDIAAVEKILGLGCDIDEDGLSFGFTAAHWAAWANRHIAILELLDKYGANMSAVEETDLTPLHVAALAGNVETLSWLVNNTYDIEAKDEFQQTPLHLAAINGRLEAAKILVKRGSALEAVDAFGMTPVCIAVVRGFSSLVEFFLEKGANPVACDAHNRTLLHAAASCNDTTTIQLLLKRKVDVDANDRFNFTPLHVAAMNGSCEAIRLLLKCGADIEAKDCNGSTPLHKAQKAAQVDSVRLLLELGADPTNILEDTEDSDSLSNYDCSVTDDNVSLAEENCIKITHENHMKHQNDPKNVMQNCLLGDSPEEGVRIPTEDRTHDKYSCLDTHVSLLAEHMPKEECRVSFSVSSNSTDDACVIQKCVFYDKQCNNTEDKFSNQSSYSFTKGLDTAIETLTFEEIKRILF